MMKPLPLRVFLCLSSVSLLSPPPSSPVSVLYLSVAPSITTPCTQVMMQFMGSVLLPYIATGAPTQFLLELSSTLWIKHQLKGEFALFE